GDDDFLSSLVLTFAVTFSDPSAQNHTPTYKRLRRLLDGHRSSSYVKKGPLCCTIPHTHLVQSPPCSNRNLPCPRTHTRRPRTRSSLLRTVLHFVDGFKTKSPSPCLVKQRSLLRDTILCKHLFCHIRYARKKEKSTSDA
ncbi:unnamed protein product, partial [Ectocarpus sp. 12 AP-2014]